MTLIEEQIKLGLYNNIHHIDPVDNDLQYINSCWYVDNNILQINIDAYHKTNNWIQDSRQSVEFKIEIKSIDQINKIVSKFEDFIKELE
jgi:hypothetical protein